MATFNVPAEGWNKLEAKEQEQIREILRTNNLLNEGDDIAADNSLKMTGESAGSKVASEGADVDSTCTTACNIAEQAAVTACKLLPWPASTVCEIAAEKAGDFCRSRC
jgi:hypothetical protein